MLIIFIMHTMKMENIRNGGFSGLDLSDIITRYITTGKVMAIR